MSLKYFKNSLNYTLANEDTAMEVQMVEPGLGHVVSVAGSGGRVLPLLAKAPKLVSCVDVSLEQLYLTELRMESVRVLTHEQFLAFWGYPPVAAGPKEREGLFAEIRLSADARKYFAEYFQANGWESILYDGKWERTFAKLSRVNRAITGTAGIELFSALTDEEHARYMKERFPRKAWSLVLFVLGNAGIFNALLYKGHFPQKNIPGSFFSFYEKAFDRLFEQGPARRNFFLQLAFFGKVVFAEGCPVECDPAIFAAAKAALANTELRYCHGSVLTEARNSPRPIDYLSLSDVPSYFSGDTEKSFLQQVKPAMNPGGLVVVRSYLHVPSQPDLSGFTSVTDLYRGAISREKVQMYLTEVYRRDA